MDYRQQAINDLGPAAIAAAEAAGIPVPFYAIEGRITSLTGTIEVSAQFKDEPAPGKMTEVRESARRLIGEQIIADSLAVVLCWNPHEWQGYVQ